ncbi:helix-turn-helix transcriptional regulator [Actinoallomurus spadix]|uniref:AraC family transcriptional regulator n=1 Tax=Actinoallomurus spadix TaxID=79912 RepID=UPI002093D0E2|nr:helix-turn-helix transcriptional regulator [Actinoallomurus spadix]MCO5985223.1 helix-turn-helix transcriptional regulator [Actinoallomurus spadix]
MSVTRLDLEGWTLRALPPRTWIDWHDHARHQLIYPSRGVLEVSTGAGAWVVPPHRAVWIPATMPHAHRAHGHTEMRTLLFEPAVNPLRLDEPTVLAVTPLLREVIVALTDDTGLTGRQRHNLETVALDQLCRVEALALRLPAPADPRLRDLTAILADDPADRRTLAELGRAVGASERTLSRLFRDQTGMTFPQWRAQLRLHHSLTLLATGAPVTEVATSSGFRSPSAFIDAFRQAFGVTPGRYAGGSGPR